MKWQQVPNPGRPLHEQVSWIPSLAQRTAAITVWLTLTLLRCRSHLFCLMQPSCFGSMGELQLEEAPSWLREYGPLKIRALDFCGLRRARSK